MIEIKRVLLECGHHAGITEEELARYPRWIEMTYHVCPVCNAVRDVQQS